MSDSRRRFSGEPRPFDVGSPDEGSPEAFEADRPVLGDDELEDRRGDGLRQAEFCVKHL
jgi:hypothetical protein